MILEKKNVSKFLAGVLSVAMLAGCSNTQPSGGEQTDGGETAANDTPLVVGYSPFNQKFSPFFSETAYDQDVYAMTQIGLFNSDRVGAPVVRQETTMAQIILTTDLLTSKSKKTATVL